MSINRGTDKEDVVHIHSGILRSHKKQGKHAICSNMNATGDDQTEWIKSGEDKYQVRMIYLMCEI